MGKKGLFILTCVSLVGMFMLGGMAYGQDPIKLGISTSITGAAAGYGIHIRNGAQMTIDEINSAGGIKGRKIEMIVADDAGNPAESVSAMNRLVTKENVDAIVGGNMSSLVLANMQVAERSAVPYIVTGASNPAITRPGNKFTFRLHQSDATAALQAADYVVSKLGKKKIAIIHCTDDYGTGCKDVFAARLKQLNVTPLIIDRFNPGDKSFSSQLLKVRISGAEFLGLFGVLPEVSLITKEARDLGMKDLGVIMTGISQPKYIDLAPGATEGAFAVTPFNSALKDPEVQRLSQNYRKLYNNLDPPHQVSNTYQAIKYVLAPIWAKVGTDKVKVRDEIRKLKWTAFGNEHYFDQNGQVIMPSVIIVVRNRAWVVAD